MTDLETAEAVDNRLEGFKDYWVYASERVFYSKRFTAKDRAHAEELANEECDWGDPIDGEDFQIDEIEEIK